MVQATNCMPLLLLKLASRPPKRRIDYPSDQDCHLCHAVVIETVKKVGSIVSLDNTRKVIHSICKEATFKEYSVSFL